MKRKWKNRIRELEKAVANLTAAQEKPVAVVEGSHV